MPRALLDTTVLFAGAYRRDGMHEQALPIVRGIDAGDLPEAVVIEFVLAETLNGLATHAGHEAAVDLLDRIEENTRFHVETLGRDTVATAKARFRSTEAFSFVDACLVAYMETEGLGYLYAFDDDFDRVSDVYRLETATNPYEPD